MIRKTTNRCVGKPDKSLLPKGQKQCFFKSIKGSNLPNQQQGDDTSLKVVVSPEVHPDIALKRGEFQNDKSV